MPKVELKEIKIKSVNIILTMNEAMDLENILYNKVEDYNLDDSEKVTARSLRTQLTQIIDRKEE